MEKNQIHNSLGRVKRRQREKVLRFSIRKYSFGAASVAVAALMFLGARVVSADSVTPVDQPHVEASTQDTSPLASQDKEEPASSVKVDTTVASQLVAQIKDQLHVKEAANTDLLVAAKEELVKAEQTLANSKVSQEEVDALVARLTNVLDQLRAVETPQVKEEEKNDRSAQEATPEIKPEVAKPTSEISAKSEETSENTNAEQLEKAKASLKLSIERLEQTIAQTPENDLTREILEKAIAQVAVAKSAFGGVEVSLRNVEDMNHVIKRNESSVMIARNRLTSGSHDPHNGQSMDRGSSLRSVPIDKTKKRGQLGIVVADSGFVTGYATPSSTIEIKKNGQTLVTSTLDDSGKFNLNAPGIKVGDTVTLVVNGETVATEVVSEAHTISFNDSLVHIKQVDGYTAAESDVEITVGGEKYKTKSQSNGYFTVDVDPNLMVKDAEVKAVVTKDGKVVGRGTSIVRETKVTDFGVGWNKNPMIDYSERDVYSPDTKQYAFISKGTADQAYDNIRVYREMRIEKNGDKYYYWMVDSGPAANAKAGLIKKISLAIPRTVGDPYDFTYTQYQNGRQESHEEFPTASAWAYVTYNISRAYVKDGEKRPGSSYPENINAWMDYIEPSNGWQKNIYQKDRKFGTDPNTDAFPRAQDMTGIEKDGHEYKLVRGVIEDRMNVTAGNRTIMTFKTKVLEGDALDQSIMSDWDKKDISNPMLSEIKERLANDPYIAYGGYVGGGKIRYQPGQNAIIGTLPLKPEEATNFNFQLVSKEQTTKVGVVPDAIKSIENADQLPEGTTYRWFKDPDVSKVTEPGKPVYGTVEVVIPQRGKFLVDAAVHVIEDKPQIPIATAKDNGDVTGKPQDPAKVDKITVRYTGEDDAPKTVVGTKGTNGKWTVNNPDVRIDENTGEITIPENKVKDGTEVTVITKNGNGADSDPAKAIAKDVTGPTITAESATVTKNEPITPIPVTAVDNTGGVGMRDNNPIEVTGLPTGLTYANNQITGTPTAGKGDYSVTITAYDKNNTPSTKTIKITVQDQLAGTATGKTVPEKTPVPANTKVVTPNKPGTTISVDGPVNGLTVDNGGNLVGTPTVTDWGPKEEEKNVEIPVKLKNGTEETVVKVPVTIQRDTDGDGTPDKVDSDDDNDGIPDTEDANPKVADKLTGTVTGKTVPEKTPVPANTKVVTPNKPGTTITVDNPVNGLTVDNGGNLVGTPTVTDWGPKEEERTVEIPVKLKRGTEETVVKVPVKIQRDTDGDGIPDVTDPDDDNDGIPDTEDANPKVADKLTGTVTGKTVPEKTPVPADTKVVTPNKPGTTITVDSPVNGLTVDNGGNLVGTPTVTDWGPKEEERTVEIPVKLKRGTEETVVKVPVKIQRDTDGDGTPDVTDPDDDNDGIPDKDDANPKVADKLTGTVTGKTVPEKTPVPANTKVVTPNKPTLVRLVQFSKVFVAPQATTILVYHLLLFLSIPFFIFFTFLKLFLPI
ncbi:YSIRK-type signal peptide-containing protein [Streptococcus anginosus]|uniref:YSIRK-type signal peptide-containing protein n=1 Tax=Streptococcus anginosus TaxID=1328 RepID=UPI0030820090|nr:YSIRK-type signal peptide-containing protein [Streptococcus anginosus]